jgi:hypothetical protein
MYEFLLQYFSRKWSTFLTGIWYLVLILLILYMSLTPEGELRYLNY